MSVCWVRGCEVVDPHYHTTKGVEFSRMEKIEVMVELNETIKKLTTERDALKEKLKFAENFLDTAHGQRDELRKTVAQLKARVGRYREALESLCYSIAGTEGTKTNSELPEWFRLRLKDANKALSEGGGAE